MTDTKSRSLWSALLAVSITVFLTGTAVAHGVAEGDQAYLQQTSGPQIGAFMYLGAKHMVTGYMNAPIWGPLVCWR